MRRNRNLLSCMVLAVALVLEGVLPTRAATCDTWDWPHTDGLPTWWCDDNETYATQRTSGTYKSSPFWEPRPFTIHRHLKSCPAPGTYQVELLWVVWYADPGPGTWIPPLHWWGSGARWWQVDPEPPVWWTDDNPDWHWRPLHNWRQGSYWWEIGDQVHNLWYCGSHAASSYGPDGEYDRVGLYWWQGEITFTEDSDPTLYLTIRLPGWVGESIVVYTRDEGRMWIMPEASPPKWPIDIMGDAVEQPEGDEEDLLFIIGESTQTIDDLFVIDDENQFLDKMDD